MIRRAFIAVVIALTMAMPVCAAEQSVPFMSDPDASAMQAAIGVLRASYPRENIRLSTVQAAFIRLVDGEAPQLVVELSGDNCGSAGCLISLYERGTNGWVMINNWLASSIGIAPEHTGKWHNIVLDHNRTWIMQNGKYELRR